MEVEYVYKQFRLTIESTVVDKKLYIREPCLRLSPWLCAVIITGRTVVAVDAYTQIYILWVVVYIVIIIFVIVFNLLFLLGTSTTSIDFISKHQTLFLDWSPNPNHIGRLDSCPSLGPPTATSLFANSLTIISSTYKRFIKVIEGHKRGGKLTVSASSIISASIISPSTSLLSNNFINTCEKAYKLLLPSSSPLPSPSSSPSGVVIILSKTFLV